MKITALQSVDFSAEGHDLLKLKTHETVDVDDDLAELVIKHGLARDADDDTPPEPEPETSVPPEAPAGKSEAKRSTTKRAKRSTTKKSG